MDKNRNDFLCKVRPTLSHCLQEEYSLPSLVLLAVSWGLLLPHLPVLFLPATAADDWSHPHLLLMMSRSCV